jgi:hypothetical protein
MEIEAIFLRATPVLLSFGRRADISPTRGEISLHFRPSQSPRSQKGGGANGRRDLPLVRRAIAFGCCAPHPPRGACPRAGRRPDPGARHPPRRGEGGRQTLRPPPPRWGRWPEGPEGVRTAICDCPALVGEMSALRPKLRRTEGGRRRARAFQAVPPTPLVPLVQTPTFQLSGTAPALSHHFW